MVFIKLACFNFIDTILAFENKNIIRIFQCLVLAAIALCSLFVGVANVNIFNVWSLDADQLEILFISRVPRLCSILVAGSSLAISGLIMQRITGNRFVSPTIAGTMEWCRLGVMIAILCFADASPMLRVLAAFVVSLMGTSLFLAFVTRIQSRDIILVPLLGIMLGGVVNAGSTFFAYQYDIVQNMASWLQGNFSLIIQGNYELLYLSVPFIIIAYLYADRFTIVGMGRSATVTLGLNHANIVRMGLVIVSVISSITIVGVGNIPFVGLIVPNIVSIFRGDSVKNILFDTAWLGALLVLICDIAGRLILYPYEIPIGIILSIVGSVVFLALLFSRRVHV